MSCPTPNPHTFDAGREDTGQHRTGGSTHHLAVLEVAGGAGGDFDAHSRRPLEAAEVPTGIFGRQLTASVLESTAEVREGDTVLAMSPQQIVLVGIVAIWGFWVGGSSASFAGVVHTRGWKGAMRGRSGCDCGEPVPAKFNIPVFGWLRLGGKARCCGTQIPTRWFAGEVAGATCGVAGAMIAGLTGAAVGGMLGGVVAYTIYIMDIGNG